MKIPYLKARNPAVVYNHLLSCGFGTAGEKPALNAAIVAAKKKKKKEPPSVLPHSERIVKQRKLTMRIACPRILQRSAV